LKALRSFDDIRNDSDEILEDDSQELDSSEFSLQKVCIDLGRVQDIQARGVRNLKVLVELVGE
jgi:hypothetical protein